MILYTQSNDRNSPLIKTTLYLSQASVCMYMGQWEKGLVEFALFPMKVSCLVCYS